MVIGLLAGKKCEEGNVIILSDEDNLEKTIRPRLEANGANLEKNSIIWMESVKVILIQIANCSTLNQIYRNWKQ